MSTESDDIESQWGGGSAANAEELDSPGPRKRKNWLKRIVIVFFVLVAVVFVAGILSPVTNGI